MFTKIIVATAVILATASASFAATNRAKVPEPAYFTHATGADWWVSYWGR